MKKLQMVTIMNRVDETLAHAAKGVDVTKDLAELRDYIKSVRKQWWNDSTAMYNSLVKILDSFYAQAWNAEFRDTEKKRKARGHYANLILDQVYHSNGGAFRRGEDETIEYAMAPTVDLDAVPSVVTIQLDGGTVIRLIDIERTDWVSIHKDELEALKEKAWKYDELG